jgi:hypothetical protein
MESAIHAQKLRIDAPFVIKKAIFLLLLHREKVVQALSKVAIFVKSLYIVRNKR